MSETPSKQVTPDLAISDTFTGSAPMRLIRLACDRPSFKTVVFKREGLSLIVGRQRTASSKNTYNGVGKSLLVTLIHFCLGSDELKNLAQFIPGWTFVLSFEMNGREHQASRNTSSQKQIFVDGEETSLADFRVRLGQWIFGLRTAPGPSFRSLISHFVRPNAGAYGSPTHLVPRQSDFQSLITNGYLLGLDIALIREKSELKGRLDQLRKTKTTLDKDSLLRSLLVGKRDLKIELSDLQDQIELLADQLQRFQVADNYYSIQLEANHTKRTLGFLRNDIVAKENAVKAIQRSLAEVPDIPPARVLEVYRQVNLLFPESVKKTLSEVHDFHNQLLANRRSRLKSDLNRLTSDIESKRSDLMTLNALLDSQLAFLNTFGALDEYLSLTSKLSDLRARAQRLRDYAAAQARVSTEINQIKAEFARENTAAIQYLLDFDSELTRINDTFRNFSKNFYASRPGGILVENNDGENQTRFNVAVRLEDDASDGIRAVAIFCYDLALLVLRIRHQCGFLFHDSRLFPDIDHRQRATLFQLADKTAKQHAVQYIATINQDSLDSFRDLIPEEEFDLLVRGCTVLELTDEAAEGKLLGIQVDMDYDF